MKFLKIVLLVGICCFWGSCDSDMADEIIFIGDNQVREWNLDASFPNWENVAKTANIHGGISILEEKKQLYSDKKLVILLGTNDAVTSGVSAEINAYADKYVDCIAKIGKNNMVYLFSIPPSVYYDTFNGLTEVQKNENIKLLNAAIRERAERLGWTYIDIYDDFLKDGRVNSELVIGDHIHNQYTPKGYSILTAKLLSVWE